jgi:acetyl/propionyl-CoA carboxylase alpha subunit
MRHFLRLDGVLHEAALTQQGLLLDEVCLPVEGARTDVFVAGTDERWFVWLDGEVYEVSVLEPLTVYARSAAAVGGLEARAPMPGNVVAVPVAVGDLVRAGDTLVIIESMKLEVAIKAPQPGRVAEIRCAVGRGFDKDVVLITLSADVEA